MATNEWPPRLAAAALLLVLASAPARSREASSDPECQAAAAHAPLEGALAKVAQNPDELHGVFALADAWSDAGCFGNAVSVLQDAEKLHPGDAQLETRLRVAKSLVGEQHFFDDLARADTQAKLKRATFRCETLQDVAACGEAANLKPDDASILAAQGDAFMRAGRAGDALSSYRRAESLAPGADGLLDKIRAAEGGARTQVAALPAPRPKPPGAVAGPAIARISSERRYSNLAPPGQTH